MSAPVAEDTPAAAERPPRMWRKLIAFRHDQKDALRSLAAAVEGDDQGNVSAVVREAVDEYIERKGAAQQ